MFRNSYSWAAGNMERYLVPELAGLLQLISLFIGFRDYHYDSGFPDDGEVVVVE